MNARDLKLRPVKVRVPGRTADAVGLAQTQIGDNRAVRVWETEYRDGRRTFAVEATADGARALVRHVTEQRGPGVGRLRGKLEWELARRGEPIR